MTEYFCYTTVFNAMELFALCRTKREQLVIEHAMDAMKILGLNGKSAKNLGGLYRRAMQDGIGDLEALVAGVCVESRLPLLTGHPERYRGIRSLRLVSPGNTKSSRTKGT